MSDDLTSTPPAAYSMACHGFDRIGAENGHPSHSDSVDAATGRASTPSNVLVFAPRERLRVPRPREPSHMWVHDTFVFRGIDDHLLDPHLAGSCDGSA